MNEGIVGHDMSSWSSKKLNQHETWWTLQMYTNWTFPTMCCLIHDELLKTCVDNNLHDKDMKANVCNKQKQSHRNRCTFPKPDISQKVVCELICHPMILLAMVTEFAIHIRQRRCQGSFHAITLKMQLMRWIKLNRVVQVDSNSNCCGLCS
jgi:hypothetical protein